MKAPCSTPWMWRARLAGVNARPAVLRHQRGDVGLQRQGVAGDLALAGRADRRVGGVGLLHHGAEQAGVFGQLALEDLAAEVDVAEQALERIRGGLVGGGGEDAGGHLAEVGGGGDAELLLGAEVVEEGALGDARPPGRARRPRWRRSPCRGSPSMAASSSLVRASLLGGTGDSSCRDDHTDWLVCMSSDRGCPAGAFQAGRGSATIQRKTGTRRASVDAGGARSGRRRSFQSSPPPS